MRAELIIKSKGLVGTSDLTLLAPIIPGLVENSLEAVSYQTRVKRLLEALSVGRATSHEYALLRPFSDAVERVGKIHSVRVTVFEPENQVLLAVSFDGTWESYIRVLWQKVGALLDVIFCNTVDYVSAVDSSFDEWKAWVDRVQRETCFYYGTPGLTVDDVHLLRKQEALLRRGAEASLTNGNSGHAAAKHVAMEVAVTRQTVRSAEDQAWDTARHTSPAALVETGRQALQSLSFIHRLTSLYPPGSSDGRYLKRAARELLREFIGLHENSRLGDPFVAGGQRRFNEQLAWLLDDAEPSREVPTLPARSPDYDRQDVQAGIVSGYADVSHGCLALLRIEDRDGAAALLYFLNAKTTRDGALPKDPGPYVNAAFSVEGLRAIGLDDAALEVFPLEFRQGMEARASMLSDFRHNHPRRWTRSLRNWPAPAQPAPEGTDGDRVDLAEVHCIVHVRAKQLGIDPEATDDHWLYDDRTPIGGVLAELNAVPRVRILAVEPMRRHLNKDHRPREHFGFADGESDPSILPTRPLSVYNNQVHLGELLLGHDNQADFAPSRQDPGPHRWLRNGSFLVVRKLRQDVPALEAAIEAAIEVASKPLAKTKEAARQLLLERMMGRGLTGEPLVKAASRNDFDFSDDPLGRVCPFHSHIRRANPREFDGDDELPQPPGRRTPRLARRGMSYGPTYSFGEKSDSKRNAAERGLMFMAYNASIGEQFEVLQRWLAGGNSTGAFSGVGDPFIGVAPNGQKRHFRFEHDDRVVSVALDGADRPLEEPRPFVRVEWGAYLFAPSISALGWLREVAEHKIKPAWSAARAQAPAAALPWCVPSGASDEAIEAWKEALEDPEAIERFRAADLWALLRGEDGSRLPVPGKPPVRPDGAVCTPLGVLAVRADVVNEVLSQPERFTVQGYQARLGASIGEIFLGQDPGSVPDPKAQAVNQAILDLNRPSAFKLCFTTIRDALFMMTEEERQFAQSTKRPRWELNLNLRELTDKALQRLCQEWFGLDGKDTREFRPGAMRWDLKPGEAPTYPGHFMPPSRYVFQPHPSPFTAETGQRVGRQLTRAMKDLVRRHHKEGKVPHRPDGDEAPIAKAIFDAFSGQFDTDQVARYMVGALMGMLPTLEGNLLRVLDEWLRDGSFWCLRQQLRELTIALDTDTSAEQSLEAVEQVLLRPLTETMQLRPSPELIWRTATQPATLGGLAVGAGDKVVVSQVACAHALLADGRSNEKSGDLSVVFGGYREAAVQPVGQPTHACPGYQAAVGALLGTLAGLLATDQPMRASPARLAVNFEGPTVPAASPKKAAIPDGESPVKEAAVLLDDSFAKRLAQAQHDQIALVARGHGEGWLLAEGDSWFDDLGRFGVDAKHSLLRLLEDDYGYRVESVAQAGDSLAEMASDKQIEGFARRLGRMVALGRQPKCIVLSAGGNDVTGEKLLPLIEGRTEKSGGLDEGAVRQAVNVDMADQLKTLIRSYTKVCRRTLNEPVPIVLHGYDYPVPDGRNLFGIVDPRTSWLYPSLTSKGYQSLEERVAVMKDLIDRLNDMQRAVANEFPHVVHLDLRQTLSVDLAGQAYMSHWANELHPTEAGFELLAKRVADRLELLFGGQSASTTSAHAAPPESDVLLSSS